MSRNNIIKYTTYFIIVIVACLFLSYTTLSIQNIILVSGQYLDQKGNAIDEATVKYLQAGLEAGSDITDDEGNFSFQATLVGMQPIAATYQDNFEIIGANPFTQETRFRADVEEEGILSVFGMQGKLIAQEELQAGSYDIRWGGQNAAPGVYLVNLQTKKAQKTVKIVQQQSSSRGLEARMINTALVLNSYKSSTMTDDSITFTKPNTSYVHIPAYGHDTTFTQIGNVGIEVLEQIQSVIANIGDTLEWNTYDYHYNDDETIISTIIPGAEIINDSTYRFIVTEAGVFTQEVELQDQDLALTPETFVWEVYVDQPNIPPVAVDDYLETNEDEQGQVDLDANDYDPDGEVIPSLIEIITEPIHGEIVVDEEGLALYIPASNYNGQDEIEYRIPDNEGLWDTAMVYVQINPMDDGPIATDPIPDQEGFEDNPMFENISDNYYHPDGDLVNIVEVEGLPEGSDWSQEGQVVAINAPENYNGTITGIVMHGEDPDGDPITFNEFNWTLMPMNDAPVAQNDGAVTEYNTAVEIDVAANDYDIDDGLDLESIIITENPEHGTAEPIGGGKILYTPENGFSGTDPFKYQISDNGNPPPILFDEADVNVSVAQGNTPPIANDDNYNTGEDVPHVGTPAENDTDLETGVDPNSLNIIINTENGLATVENGIVTYEPNPNWYGEDSLQYEISDFGDPIMKDSAWVHYTVAWENDAPTANDDIANVNEDESVDIPVTNNDNDDLDPEGGIDETTVTITTPPNNGQATANTDGSITYDPNPNWNGTDTLYYKVKDNGVPPPALWSNIAEVIVHVAPMNDDPSISIDDQVVDEDTPTPHVLDDNLDDNASDPDGDDLTYTVVSQTNTDLANVEVQNDIELVLAYLQADGYGSSIIGVEADDGNGGADTAYFELTVDQLNDTYFKIINIMTNQKWTGNLKLGSETIYLADGDTVLQVTPGTKEVNAEVEGSWDGHEWWNAPHYTAIQRPGQLANVEQRAQLDFTSQVTFTASDDTLYIYKIPTSVNLGGVQSAICTGPQGQTIRFAWNPDNPYGYFDITPPNEDPTALTESIVQDFLFNHLPGATNGKLNMQYDKGTTPPTEPYLELAINNDFPGPGTNGTGWDSNYEITSCFAHWPGNQSTFTIWTEMIQAIQNQNDTGIDLVEYVSNTWHISTYGKQCLTLGYNFDPGTKF